QACELVEREGYRLGDHKAVKLRHLTDPAARGVHVAVVAPGLPAEACGVLGVQPCESVAGALEWLRQSIRGPFERGIVIEDAGNVSVAAHRPIQSRGGPAPQS